MVTILDTEHARQGHSGDGVRAVLSSSIFFTVVAMGLALWLFG